MSKAVKIGDTTYLYGENEAHKKKFWTAALSAGKDKQYYIIREFDIACVQMAVNGMTRKQIADKLEISTRTLEGIFMKMNKIFETKTPYHLIGIFFRNNLIT